MKIKKFYESLHNHEHKMKLNYRPKYRVGLVAVRFLGDEQKSDKEYPYKYPFNYQELFSEIDPNGTKKRRFVLDFFKKYNLKRSDFRNYTDDYYIYFKCEPGKESEILRELSKDEIVIDVDYVDVKQLETKDELENIRDEITSIIEDYSEESTEESNNRILSCINKLKELL